MLPFVAWLEKKAEDTKDRLGVRFAAWPVFIAACVVFLIALIFATPMVAAAVPLAFITAPLWLPFLVVRGAYDLWYLYARAEFLAKRSFVLLELKPPRNLVKTPLAMETFLSTLHLTGGESNWWARLNGGTRPYFSLEIASLEGQVHFYLLTETRFRRLVESQLYSQYPGVQVMEASDYSRAISATTDAWTVWGVDYKQTAKNSDPLPIKTYVEFGLEKVQKEPEQVDPLASIIEFMGAAGKGEYIWLQYVIRAHKGEKFEKELRDFNRRQTDKKKRIKAYTWVERGTEMVADIRKATQEKYIDPVTKKEMPGFPNPTKGQAEKIAAIERNIAKLAFDVGIRSVYVCKKDKMNSSVIPNLISLYKPFTSPGWNGIDSTAWMKKFDDYPWEIGTQKKKDKFAKELVEAYRRRQFFYHPLYEGSMSPNDIMVMSTEELATVFHIPSRAVETPGLGRIASATSEAPVNLPI
jgi:hypothetical protein